MTTARVPTGAPERAAAPHATNPAADQWVAVGPGTVVRGQATGRPRVSGRIRALAVSPDGQRIYAGTALGGVWYSANGGDHWMSLDFYASTLDANAALQHADALTVGAIEVVWGTPATDVVYVGAGEHPTLGLETPSAALAAVGIRVATGPAVAVAPLAPAGAPVVGAATADPWRVEAVELAGLAVNQFARDVTNGVMWAATSRGLYRRTPAVAAGPGVPAVPVQWTNVVTPLGDVEISAVVTVAGVVAAEPQRLYIASATGRMASSTDGVAWLAIELTAFPEAQVPAAVQITRVRLAVANGPAHPVIYALADGPRLWRIDVAAVERVTGLPRVMSAADPNGQAPFGLAIAAHPTNDLAHQDTIVVGGQTFDFPVGRRQAALFVGQVTNVAGAWTIVPAAPVDGAPAEWIGSGIPAGVHALAWVAGPGPTHLWVGGDGGAFRSTRDGERKSFAERNTGLSAIEVTTLAQASDCDAVMLVGTRSNGVLRRRSSETWDVVANGQAGGVAIDPGNARRMYAQAQGSAWRYSDNGGRTLSELAFRTSTPPGLNAADAAKWTEDKKVEDEGSAPISRLALMEVPGSPRGTLKALGTNRIWYTDDALLRAAAPPVGAAGRFLTGWVTLPTLTDPYAAAAGAPALAQDRLEGAVLVCSWGSADRLYVMTSRCIYLFQRKPDATWNAPEKLYDQIDAKKNWKGKTPKGVIPDDLTRISLAVHQVDVEKGRLYVGTSGPSDKQHLWWYDGDGHWLATGFARDTPVYTIAVDPMHNEIVYIGTGAGVWRGTVTFPANADPTWVWTRYSSGLPDAACVDLALYSPTGAPARVLRAALAGRGVWEVALDNVQQGPEIYLRAHGFDSRRSPVPAGGPRDPLCAARVQTPLDASPDIRVWRTPGAAPPGAVNYDIAANSDTYDIWRMISALRAAGEDVDPKEGWNALTEPARNRVRNVLFPAPPNPPTAKEFWEALLAGNPLPHDRTPPDPADLVTYLRDEPDRWPKDTCTSCVSTDGTARVYVTVHSRHWRPIVAGTVRVALLKTEYARHHSLDATRPLPAGWGASLRADRDTLAAGPWPPGSPALLAPPRSPLWLTAALWEYADPVRPFQTVGGRIDPHNPQVVTFDVALSGVQTWHTPGWLLLAVVLVDGDVAGLADQDVGALVRTDRRVAARSVRNAALLSAPLTVYGGMDTRDYGARAATEQGWRDSNLMVTGLYLDSPARAAGEIVPVVATAVALGQIEPPPGLAADPALDLHIFGGHNRNANNPLPGAPTAWMRAKGEIWPAWGLLPIYWGHQDARNGDSPHAHRWDAKGPFDLRVVIAEANAADAAVKAVAAGFAQGAVIYIDWEISAAPDAAHDLLRDNYLNAFWRALAALGYRPGVYARPNASPALRQLCPGLFVWSVNSDNGPAAPNATVTPAPAKLVLRTPELTNPNAPDVDAIARQWRLDFVEPAGNPVPGIFQLDGAGVRHIDGNVTVVADPSFPERRVLTTRLPVVLTTRIRGGRVTAAPTVAGQCAIYTVRRSRPARTSGALAAMGRDPGADLVKDDVKFLWNPFSVPASLRVPGPVAAPDPTDVFLALGIAELEGEDVWRLQALRKPPTVPWLHETVPDTGFAIDPLSGVAAVTRTDQSIDAFVVMDPAVRNANDGQLAVARWNPTTFSWSPLTAIAGATARRTNRHASVSRNIGVADVFWIDSAGRVATSSSAAADPTAWSPVARIGNPLAPVLAHPFANLAAVARDANRIDVLYIGMDPVSNAWRLIDVWWTAPGPWGANSQVAGGILTNVEPLASIAACNRDANNVDAFVVGLANGALYVTTLARATGAWSALRTIGGVPASRLASVDSACGHGANDVQVVVTGRDGNVYATEWDAVAADYGALRQIVVLNV